MVISTLLPWHAHISVWIIMGGVLTFFWWAISRLGPSLVAPGEVVITRRQKAWIVAGVAWTWIFAEYPIHDMAEKYLFFVHMIQHTVFTLVSPACFLLGSPDWLWRWALRNQKFRATVRFMSRPFVALMIFNTMIVVTHMPAVVERSGSNEWFHFSVHFVLFASATVMWIPVINRTDLLPKLKIPTKMIYLFAQSIVPTVPASFLTFAEKPMYRHYAVAPRLISGMDARIDQQWAAVGMKLGAGSLIWGIVGYLFFRWWQDSQSGLADDNLRRPVAKAADPGPLGDGVLTWDRVRAEFARIEASDPGTEPGPEPGLSRQAPDLGPEG